MERITLEQMADFFEDAVIEHTHDFGHTIVHSGISGSGARFVLLNDCWGESTLSEGM